MLLKRLAASLLLRRLSRDLAAIVACLEQQNALLARLADHLAPVEPPPDRATLVEETGLTHLDDVEAGLALAFIERTQHATGHTPNDEEVLIYLADEKTTDLHKRLVERDEQLARLAESQR